MKKLLWVIGIIVSFLFQGFVPLQSLNDQESITNAIPLNLRVHIIQSSPWIHPLGTEMESWVSPSDVKNTILPEVNRIWKQANIQWEIESIIEEDIRPFKGFENSIDFVINTKRDAAGKSDPKRLPHLYRLMKKRYKSTPEELGTNLFHIYLFPFIGNTSQGNAMRPFGYHTVVGTWSNKHNRGGIPEKTLLVEDENTFVRGSLSRTIAHELGHVLSLGHNQCNDCLMKASGYRITAEQIEMARKVAMDRSK